METLDLSYFFKTKAQANDFSSRIAAVLAKIYQADFQFEKVFMEEFGIQKKDAFLTLLRENSVSLDSNSALQEFLDKIVASIATMPVLALTLAFEPREQTLQAISEWFLINIHKQVLFDISVNPDLIAGSAISFNGRYIDFSIKPKFAKVLNDVLHPKPESLSLEKEDKIPQPEVHQNVENINFGR